jgi:hypothetical protein
LVQVHPFEDQAQLGRGQLPPKGPSFDVCGDLKSPGVQPLVEQTEAGPVIKKYFHMGFWLVYEDKEMSTAGVEAEAFDQAGEAVKREVHADRIEGEIDLDGGGKGQHARTTLSTLARVSSEKESERWMVRSRRCREMAVECAAD